MNQRELILKLDELLGELGFDYDRMSRSGQETYDEMCKLVEKLLASKEVQQ